MLELIDIHKTYAGAPLLAGVSLRVEGGETVCLLGASGSGKSTLLRIIAGLERPDAGRVLWEGEDIADLPVHRRGFGLVFQDYALFPHLDVAGNVAFGLRMQRLPADEIRARALEALRAVDLAGFETRRVTELSGGEQQRVALARALAPRPRLLMFDEPLGALDRALRGRLAQDLRQLLRASGVPALYVTHDQEEAFALADRVLLLHDGRLVQSGTPAELHLSPASAWVADFLGLGELVPAVSRGDGTFQDGFGTLSAQCDHVHAPGADVTLLLRPGAAVPDETAATLRACVTDAVYHPGGGYHVRLENGLRFDLPASVPTGTLLGLRLLPGAVLCLGGEVE